MKTNKIYLGDCIEKMKMLPENSIDAIVTDPPYGIGFLGKIWDTMDSSQFGIAGEEGANDLKVKKNFKVLPRFSMRKDSTVNKKSFKKGKGSYPQGYVGCDLLAFQLFSKSWATEALRVLKPGGFLLSFAGTRTYHRLVCGIEDAGFSIRDTILYLYGVGFPKSLNVGKAIEEGKGEGL